MTVVNETGDILKLLNQFLIVAKVLLLQLNAFEMRLIGVNGPVVNDTKLSKGRIDDILNLLRDLLQLLDLSFKKFELLLLSCIFTKLNHPPLLASSDQLIYVLCQVIHRPSHVLQVVNDSSLLYKLPLGF